MPNLIKFGDCREIMRFYAELGLQARTCVTSPPYYGLRDYGHAGQIGLEQTPDDYIAAMVEVFRCVRDVLTDDGTLWLNLGDSYASDTSVGRGKRTTGLGNKQLLMMPARVAIALQSDGWYLRQEIIWHKPNPMPESVTDRCTKSHEKIYLLAKQPKYYFDAEAIREPAKWERWGAQTENKKHSGTAKHLGNKTIDELPIRDTKNKRDVWAIPTRGYPGAHFATFPPALIEPCVLAGSALGDAVLDPFMGSGTTAQVALMHGRQYLGCELNEDYRILQDQRLGGLTVPSS
jgi:DNA modification methylase